MKILERDSKCEKACNEKNVTKRLVGLGERRVYIGFSRGEVGGFGLHKSNNSFYIELVCKYRSSSSRYLPGPTTT